MRPKSFDSEFYSHVRYINVNSAVSDSSFIKSSSVNHLVTFTGLGVNQYLIDFVNSLSKLLESSNIFIALTDRGDLDNFIISPSVLRIPCSSREIPRGYANENYIISELLAIQSFCSEHEYNFTIFTKLRKDLIFESSTFLSYLISIPSFLDNYEIILSSLSSNWLRKFCLSDICFSVKMSHFLSTPMSYRKYYNFQSLIRKVNIFSIYSPFFEAEQFIWSQLFKAYSIPPDIKYIDYISWLNTNVISLLPSSQGILWTRNDSFILNNWYLFSDFGKHISTSFSPLRNFFSYLSCYRCGSNSIYFQRLLFFLRFLFVIKTGFIIVFKFILLPFKFFLGIIKLL